MVKIKPISIALFLFMFCVKASDKNIAQQKVIIEKPVLVSTITDPKADQIIAKAIEAHGGELYDHADYSFFFRKEEYRFINNDNSFTYEKYIRDNNGNAIKDVIVNGTFTRYNNESTVNLSEKSVSKYAQALNSVIYFATLPHKLKDDAVNKSYGGKLSIKGESYNVIKVWFNKEGGGSDHDDTYYYWVNVQTNLIDYLAYNYKVNGGGTRFRSSYNRRNVDGVVFQDYVNWKASKNTPLEKLPQMFERNDLKELSRIETEQVQNNKK